MAKPLLLLEDLVVGYDFPLLPPVSCALEAGQSLLIQGANGAGKSTLLRTLFGLLKPMGGSVRWLDDIPVRPRELVSVGVRFLGQGNRGFGEMRALDQARVLGRLYGLPPPPRAFGRNFDQRVNQLSYGQRRLAALDLLRAGAPVAYLLDEPLAGLDRNVAQQVVQWCRNIATEGSSLIMIEHRSGPLLDIFDLSISIQGRFTIAVGRGAERHGT